MSRTRILALAALFGAALGVLAGVQLAHADITASDFSTQDTTNGSSWDLRIGTGWSGQALNAQVFYGASISTTPNAPLIQVEQWATSSYTGFRGTCAFEDTPLTNGIYATTTQSVSRNPGNDSGVGCVIDPSSYVEIVITSNVLSPDHITFFGASSAPAWIIVQGTPMGSPVQVPYFRIGGVFGNQFGLDFTQITPAPPFTLGSTTSAIAASSSLWGSLQLASTSLSCSTGNLFSDGLCTGLSFLFVPSPSVLQAFTGLPSLYVTKFPFSYFVGVEQLYSSLSASTTANAGEVKIDFSSVDPATSTPFGGFLPDATLFSTSTITQYMPAWFWPTMQLWISLGLWLTLAADIFFSVRNKMHKT